MKPSDTRYRVDSIEELLSSPPVVQDVHVPAELKEPVELFMPREQLLEALRTNLEAIHLNREHVVIEGVDIQDEADRAIGLRERLLAWLADHKSPWVYVRLCPCETHEDVPVEGDGREPWEDQED